MSKMVSLFTYFIIFIITSWGLYYILQFYGYEQALIFLNVYIIYYLFLFITVFFAIIFNTYIGVDMTDPGCPNTSSNQEKLSVNAALPPMSSSNSSPLPSSTPVPVPASAPIGS